MTLIHGALTRPRSPKDSNGRCGASTRTAFISHPGGSNMAVARSDEGPGNVTRRRMQRRPQDGPPPTPPPAGAPTGNAVRLDDLYRLPMPKLFALAEREGIAEHTGMNRGQLIVGVVR